MGSHLVEPGSVLDDRYVVEDLLAQEGQSESWRARDRILARSVVLHILPSSSAHATELIACGKRASRVADPRVLQVFDAIDDGELSYLVREWATGQSLDLILADGPLSARKATWLMREVAAAVVKAHRTGLPHGRLVPDAVVLTEFSGVKIMGLGTSLPLRGNQLPGDPELADTVALGRLLYACLTVRWPGGSLGRLPAAPTEHGRLLRPRQVRAGVPRSLDAVCDRVLTDHSRYGEPITSAVEFKAQLTEILTEEGVATNPGVNFIATPSVAVGSTALRAPGVMPRDTDGPVTGEQPIYADSPATDESPLRRTLFWSVVLMLVVGAVLLAYLVGQQGAGAQGRAPAPSSNSSGSNQSATPPKTIAIQAADDFDPQGVDGENSDLVPLAIDDDPTTAWKTVLYENNPELGGLKSGVGLLLDLGQLEQVSDVKVGLGGDGTSLELRAAPPAFAAGPSSAVEDYEVVGSVELAGDRAEFALDKPVRTRFLLVWLTSLPSESADTYQGRVSDIEVLG
ncbi:MAG: hypothetical protein H0V49_04200 [Nocardioidaceae bacterium]|nr:hypothetical protein [Nocardioidaceae bacterium]